MTAPPVGAYLLDADAHKWIYGTDQQGAIARLCRVHPRVFSRADVTRHAEELRDVEFIFSGWGAPVMDDAFLELVPNLKVVFYGAGTVAGFVTNALVRRGVRVTSAASGNAVPVADYTVAAIYFSLKNVWTVVRGQAFPDVESLAGGYESTVGLVALGAVGRLVCQRLRSSDLSVVAFDPFVSASEAGDLGVRLLDLAELFACSDVVSLHVPLNASTRGLIGSQLLASMKAGATLINTSRGAVVDPDALVEVLEQRLDLQAILDVTDPEPLPMSHRLRALPNVVITPHIAGSLGRECHRLGDMMVEEFRRYLAGEALAWQVDLANLEQIASQASQS
ncbi:MAG TPA: hydroxyacid dehydrogenase [Acidothermaceae bacterium]|jgi:phosphoglycerate dehydrogenase-like enzyme